VTTERQKKIYHSLFLILFLNVGGYFVANTVIVLKLLSLFPLLPFNNWYPGQFAAILMNIAAAANAPILYSNRFLYCENLLNITLNFTVRNTGLLLERNLAKLRTALAWLTSQRKVHPQTIPI
jgi:hypothetical protein